MTKTYPNTKENLQNRRKASRQSKEYKKTRKSQKCEDLCCSSCHDGSYLLAKTSTEENMKKICSSCYDTCHRGTMALLGDQADETHKISYNSELNLPIVLRWTHRSTMAC
ncbi:hypothetical protein QL285_094801 [Trifolium repens]|nr:hypothetical protein QL285_094801 [Trifolium repens]